MTRMAGQLIQRALGAGLLGAGGAVAADALMHDDLDRLAQGARDFNVAVYGAPPEAQEAYMAMFGQAPVSNMDRLIVTNLLKGNGTGPVDGGPIQADSPAGAKAIEMALEVRQANPALAATLAALSGQEIELLARSAAAGVDPAQTIEAVNQGAGVSPLPAILGGAGLGAVGAAVPPIRGAFRAGGSS
jgi:hypothetical protein